MFISVVTYNIIPQRCTVESYSVKKIICIICNVSIHGGKNSIEDTRMPTGANEQKNLKNNRPCTLALAGYSKYVSFYFYLREASKFCLASYGMQIPGGNSHT